MCCRLAVKHDYTATEPPSYAIAAKHPQWVAAMDSEFQPLQKQKTWSLVPLPANKNVVTYKSVYRLKRHADGSIARYRARLVARGYLQQYGLDYDETFSPVVKSAMGLLLALAVNNGWELRQLDVSNAFLHGILKEEVYMRQSQGYIDLNFLIMFVFFIRPDLSFAVQQACQFMSDPTQNHLQASKRILRYIKGTLHYGLAFTLGFPSLSAYCDADWAGDPVDLRSISGIVVFFGHCPVTWSAKKQSTISRSSTETEYRALASSAAELFWIRMLRDLGIFLSNPPLLWCDNDSALAIASNPVFRARTKHIEVDYHLCVRRFLGRIFWSNLFLPMISLLIFLLKVCLLLVFTG